MSQRSNLAKLTALATAGFLAAASLVALSGPASAAVCAGTAPSDFNGDGISDAAIGTFNVVEAGNRGVHIIYGTRQGLTADASGTALDDQRLTMTADSTTGFGAALATGDFNRDGCSDLAVGDPFALDAGHSAGVVWLYYGSVAGLPATGLLLDRSLAGATNVADGDTFGETLAVGDFNGDGRSDLAVGAQYAAPGGEVYVFPGNSIVSPLLGAKRFAEGDGTVPGVAQANDQFGGALAAGDFNGDGRSDLAIGAPSENNFTGAVFVVRGSASSTLLTPTGRQTWTQDSPEVLGTAETQDRFATTLATGSFKGNGRTDLAVGSPEEGVSGVTEAGGVNVLYSAGSTGLSSIGNQLWTQNSTGLGTAAAHAGHFAWSLASGDFNGNGRTDLAVGAPANTVNGALAAGRITIIAGSAGGLTATGSSNWSENTAGIAGTAEPSDFFGWSIAPLRVTSTGHDDLLVGVFFETLDDTGTADAGEVRLIPGSTGGLTATGSQVLSADTPGIKGTSCVGCGFGYAVG